MSCKALIVVDCVQYFILVPKDFCNQGVFQYNSHSNAIKCGVNRFPIKLNFLFNTSTQNRIYFLLVDDVAIALVYHNQTILINAHHSQKHDFRSSSVNPICWKYKAYCKGFNSIAMWYCQMVYVKYELQAQ